MPAAAIHIVTRLDTLTGVATHATTLAASLRRHGCMVHLWSDRSGAYATHCGARIIQPFSGTLPRGGTLILIGAFLQLSPWLAHARPQRLVLVCTNSEAPRLQTTLAHMQQLPLPPVELSFVSSRLRDAMVLDGELSPEIIDLDHFQPAAPAAAGSFTVGRMSRDTPDKHHPQDISLYRLLTWRSAQIRLMGGTCLAEALSDTAGVTLLPVGAEAAPAFLHSLDVFFYRTSPHLHESAGRVILEAMACGLPVVAHVSGGYTDWLRHKENGFLFRTQEEALEQLLALQNDPELRRTLGQAARATAQALAGHDSPPVQAYLDWLAR